MRRILAITLLIAFGSPLILPAFASPASTQSNLPACCRRNGTHHCTGLMSTAAGSPAFKAPPCPAYPSRSTTPGQNASTFLAPHTSQSESLRTFAPQASGQWIAQPFNLSSNLKRGPPTRIA